jgi:ribose transport system substrate-binding protein
MRSGFRRARIAPIALFVMLLGACGGGGSTSSSSSGSSSAAQEAQQLLDKYAAPVTWTAGSLPVINATQLKGHKAGYVPITPNIPVSVTQYGAWKRAMDLAGVNTIVANTDGTPESWSKGVEELTAQKAEVIQLQGINPGLIRPSIDAALAKGVKIVEGFIHPMGEAHSPGLSAEVKFDSKKIGEIVGDAAIANSNGSVNAVVYNEADYVPISKSYESGIQSEFSRLCPKTCKMRMVDITVPDWSTKLPLLTKTAIADPSVNTLIPLFDGEVPSVIPAVHEAGAQSRVKVVSFNATQEVMKYLVNKDVLVGDLGDPQAQEGFEFADQDFRAMLRLPEADETAEAPPLRMFTQTNFTATNAGQPRESWFGSLDYVAKYKQLWSIQ